MSTNHQFDLTILKFAAKQQQTRMTVNNEVQEQWSQWSGIRGLDTIEEAWEIQKGSPTPTLLQ